MRTILTRAFRITLIPLAFLAVVSTVAVRHTTSTFQRASDGHVREVDPLAKLHTSVIGLETIAYERVVLSTPEAIATYESAFTAAEQDLSRLLSSDFVGPDEEEPLQTAARHLDEAKAVVERVTQLPGDVGQSMRGMADFSTAVGEASAAVGEAGRLAEVEGEKMLDDARRTESQTTVVVVLTCIAAVLVTYWTGRRVAGDLLRPIERLHTAAQRIEGGDLDVRVELDRVDELGALGDAFDTMAARLAVSQSDLAHQAFHDSLTGLANRALLINRTDHALARLGRTGADVALLIVDLDGFKTVNDSLGHAAGDELLKFISTRIGAELRRGDTIARLGGDEFGILLEDIEGERDAAATAERINVALRQPARVAGRGVSVKASIGLAMGTIGDSADEIIRNADLAMYAAKQSGKDRWAVYESSMHDAVVERLVVEGELREAIERQEFVLHYQPTFGLQTSEVVGVEALVRWEHAERGLLAPGHFIPLAEDTGLIVPLGWWVLDTACAQAAAWREQFPEFQECTMSVNLSVRQVQEPDVVARVVDALHRSGLPANSLVLEVTESLMMEDADMARSRLTELRELGVQIAVDDFGTGYSSLSYLQEFPVDVLKIDKSFIDGIGDGEDESAMLEAIIGLARALRMKTVAEGIEEENQRDAMANLGCMLGQGYLFAKPMPREAIEHHLSMGRRALRLAPSPVALPRPHA